MEPLIDIVTEELTDEAIDEFSDAGESVALDFAKAGIMIGSISSGHIFAYLFDTVLIETTSKTPVPTSGPGPNAFVHGQLLATQGIHFLSCLSARPSDL